MSKFSKDVLIYWRGRHGPAWRYLMARDFAASSRPSPVVDRLIVDVGRYLKLRAAGGDSAATAARAFPPIAEAFRLHQNQRLVDVLRTQILGAVDIAEIMREHGLTRSAHRLWQAIFFDVHPKQDSLGWIRRHVIWPELDAGNFQLAATLEAALCPVSTDAGEVAKMILRQAQIASFAMSMSPLQSREELHELHMLAMKIMLHQQQLKLAEKRLASRQAKEERDHALAERQVRAAEQRSEVAAERQAARVQAKSDQAAQDEQLRHWHQEQAGSHSQREFAERQARIAASPLMQLTWGGTKRTAAKVAAASVAPVPRRPESSHSARSPGKRAPKVVRSTAVVGEAQGSTRPVETLST